MTEWEYIDLRSLRRHWLREQGWELCYGYWQPPLAVEESTLDLAAIKKRLEELEQERRMVANIDSAVGEWLDMHGRRWGIGRTTGEGDYNYRLRIKGAMT